MTKISVIVPVYNAKIYIEKCVHSLLAQTFRDFEIIFVNDGSKDNSLALLESYNYQDIKFKIITQENMGQAAARNHGIKYATGTFLSFVDIDDFIEPTMLEKLYQKQVETDADIVWCDAFKVIHDKQEQRLDEKMIKGNDAKSTFILNNAGPWRKLIRTSIIKDNDLMFPVIRFYEDVAVVPAYALHAEKIVYVDEPLYNYVMHEGSTMHQTSYDKRLENIFESMGALRNYFGEGSTDERMCLEYIHIDHLLHAASLRFFQFQEGQDALQRICNVMETEFPDWQKNTYFNQRDWKYKLVCKLFYKQRRWLLNRLLK